MSSETKKDLSVESKVQISLQFLRSKGFRITKTRQRILDSIHHQKDSFSAKDIYNDLKASDFDIDLVTTYRSLQTFCDLHLIHTSPSLGKYIACNNLEKLGKNIHIIIQCKSCEAMSESELDPDVSTLVYNMAARGLDKFKIEHSVLDINGYCHKCSKSQDTESH